MVMNMWARIENGTVAEITDIDPVGRFHPSLEWVRCGEDVLPGWAYDGQSFVEPHHVIDPVLIRKQVESARLLAYANPITGSDRYFAEAVRLQSTGAPQEEIDAANAAGVKRYSEIQAEYPWP